jgi:hypothetical protein
MDAPRNSDGKHAPETPKTNARTPASIFHFNSHMGDAGATPESPLHCHDDANQCLCGIRLPLRKRLIGEANLGATNPPG